MIFAGRSLVIVLMGVLPMVDQYFPDGVTDVDVDARIGLAALAAVLPLNIFFHLRLRQSGSLSPGIAFVDQLVFVAVIVAEPALLDSMLLLMLTVSAIWAAAFGWYTGLLAGATGLVALVVSLAVVEPDISPAILFFFVVGIAMAVLVVGPIASRERHAAERYQTLVSGIDAVVWHQPDPEFEALDVTSNVVDLLGHPVAAWRAPEFRTSRLHDDDRDAGRTLRTAAAEAGSAEAELRYVHADGTTVPVREQITALVDESGAVVGYRGVISDRTERHRALDRAQRFEEVIDQLPTAVFVVQRSIEDDPGSLHLVLANREAGVIFRHSAATIVGLPFVEVVHFKYPERVMAGLNMVIEHGTSFSFDDYRVNPDDPEGRVFQIHAFPVPGQAAGVAFQDVTKATTAASVLRRQALEDPLTGLGNRHRLHERIPAAIREARADDGLVSLIVLDLNRFKEVNDALGHAEGDRLLREAARRLRAACRDADVICRTGGDEFAVVYTNLRERADAMSIMHTLADVLDEPYRAEGLSLPMSATLGMACFPDDGEDKDLLVQRAEIAMYRAKRSRDRYGAYSADQDGSSVRRVSLVAELRQAIEQDQLVLHFQPGIDLRTGRPLRAEALVRWQHPEHGLMGPGEFVELAEATGLIEPLTRWVVLNAVLHARDWMERGLAVNVAVNLSVRDLVDRNLAKSLSDLLRSYGLPPSRISVEVTESELMDDPMTAMETLAGLRAAGIATAIDDFGTGYSSLTYLKHLPADEIKIDKSFVSVMNDSQSDATIVRSTIDLGHNLGFLVVAEGVEDEQTLRRLADLGCDVAQGYHIAEPLPADEFVAWLEERRHLI